MDLQYLQYQFSFYGMKKSKLQYRKKQEFYGYGFYEKDMETRPQTLYVINGEELEQYAKALEGCTVLVTGDCRWSADYTCSGPFHWAKMDSPASLPQYRERKISKAGTGIPGQRFYDSF